MINLNYRQENYLPEFDDHIISGILKYLDEDKIMLEFGSGGSTLFFPKFVKEFYSLEHYDDFYETINDKLNSLNLKNVNYFLIEPNQGKGKDVPSAKDSNISDEKYNELKEMYPYHTEHNIRRYWQFRDFVDHVDELGADKFDVVLVDGRARGFCATKVLDYIDENGIVFIDDFYTRPDEYFGPTEKENFWEVFEEVEQLERMAVLRKK